MIRSRLWENQSLLDPMICLVCKAVLAAISLFLKQPLETETSDSVVNGRFYKGVIIWPHHAFLRKRYSKVVLRENYGFENLLRRELKNQSSKKSKIGNPKFEFLTMVLKENYGQLS